MERTEEPNLRNDVDCGILESHPLGRGQSVQGSASFVGACLVVVDRGGCLRRAGSSVVGAVGEGVVAGVEVVLGNDGCLLRGGSAVAGAVGEGVAAGVEVGAARREAVLDAGVVSISVETLTGGCKGPRRTLLCFPWASANWVIRGRGKMAGYLALPALFSVDCSANFFPFLDHGGIR